MNRTLLAAVATAATIMALPIERAKAEDEQITLRLHHFNSPVSSTHKGFLAPWAERINERAKGKLKVRVYPSMQLGGKAADLYNQARDGVVDMSWTLLSYTPNRFPKMAVFGLPFVSGSLEATSKALMEYYELHAKDEFSDTVPLVFHCSPVDAIFSTKSISSLEELKDLKIRSSGRAPGDALKALGATVIGMPIPEAVESLRLGVVDGILSNWGINRTFKIAEVTEYNVSMPGFSVAPFVLTMNKESWARLSPELQQLIRSESTTDFAGELGRLWAEDNMAGREYAEKTTQTWELREAELERWKKATQPVIDAAVSELDAKGFDGAQLIADAKRLVREHEQESQ